MSDAYYEKIARINLTTGEIKAEPLDLEVAKKFIGGRGLGTKILYDEGVASVDPAKLKFAGWDALIVEGQAPDWCYLNIVDDKIEILDAREYLGVLSEELDDKLKEKHGADCSVLNIGPAGEKQVLLAAVMNDKDRAAGRSGTGAVMGSKKLKAIVVKATRKQLDVIADVEALKEANKACLKIMTDNPLTGAGLRALGTASLVNVINGIGALPTKNWQESYCPTADQFSGETLAEKYLVKPGACFHCPIACGRIIKHDDKVVGGPEYEPLWAYGSDCGNDDLYTIDECNRLCNEYGLDAIGVPCTIAAAMELYQNGCIKEEDCAGVPLEWGSKEALIEWTKRMGDPQTELDWLMSSGSARLCEHYGHPDNCGAAHVRGYMIAPEVLGIPAQLDRTVTDEKAGWAKTFQDLTAAIDSMGTCLFTSFALGAPEYASLLNAATGTNYTPEELLEVGDRIFNIERMFNKAAGMKPEDDRLPKRLLTEPISNGPSKGMVSKLDITLPQYYAARGWVNAFPTDETLKKLGLDECVGK